jgi:hypothetical protein
MILHHLPASFPTVEKKEENRETNLKNKRESLSLRGVVSLALLFQGGVMLACIGGHTRAPTKPRTLGVYDRDRVGYLSCARRSCISYFHGRICCGVRNILRVRFWWDIASVSSLATVVLRDPAQGLHWD